MRHDVITRRAMLGGATACALTPAFPTATQAFWPALVAGVNALVILWNGLKMAEEVYERFFAEKKGPVTREAERIYGTQPIIIENYYNFGNPYKISRFSNAEPGFECYRRSQRTAVAFCCGTPERPVFLPPGCIVALNEAIDLLRQSHGDDKVFAYTRPYKLITPARPWRQVDGSGLQWISDLEYYSVHGSVSLRWHITDRGRRMCRGQYYIRDDRSNRTIVEGSTSQFAF